VDLFQIERSVYFCFGGVNRQMAIFAHEAKTVTILTPIQFFSKKLKEQRIRAVVSLNQPERNRRKDVYRWKNRAS